MNEYAKLQKELEEKECPKCHGLGECDDADCGDIYFNTWKCPDCNGSGIKPETKK